MPQGAILYLLPPLAIRWKPLPARNKNLTGFQAGPFKP
jgi:hypothetical protein